MDETLTRKDARYDEMFLIENEARVFGMEIIEDPYPAFKRMLAEGPVLKGALSECMGLPPEHSGHMYRPGPTYYTAVSFNAVSDAFLDPETFSSDFYSKYMDVEKHLGDPIIAMNGSRHRRYRNVIQPDFQPATAADWWSEKVVAGAIETLISAIESQGHADLNADLFARLPMHVAAAGFGLSPEQGLDFRHAIQRSSPGGPEAERHGAAAEVLRIVGDVIRERQQEPKDDIISHLTQAEFEEEDGGRRPLTFQEIMDFCRIIVFAGGGTTWRQLGITTVALLNHPEQLEALKANRKLLPAAILESARWHPTDPLFPRLVMKDTTLRGVDLPAGAALHLCLGAANRDPTRWTDPDKFDIHRPLQRSVAFGAGPHSCLGQHLARQELVMTFNAIFDRLPNLRLDPAKPAPRITGGLVARGPGPIHVLFG
jgi:cytochrome P450